MARYIHQLKAWPNVYWDNDLLLNTLAEVRHLQGRLLGRMQGLGFDFRQEALLKTLTLDVIKSSEIEGEHLKSDEVRSSVARKLGINLPDLVLSSRDIDGIAEILVDATRNCKDLLSSERLFAWHNALFPSRFSGIHKITVGKWREDDKGPMQVVSGAMGFEFVHFEAPDSKKVPQEMKEFLNWFNSDVPLDPILKTAVAHFMFITIHPFDDGNGRIARAIADLLLARADGVNQRFYSMSAQIRIERKKYYHMLESTQKGSLDISSWMVWFLECLQRTLLAAESQLAEVLFKASFWDKNRQQIFNVRQHLMMNKLLDGFDGKLNSSKWAKICKCSSDTAIRDINDLITKGILLRNESGGRSTSYSIQKS